MKCTNTYMQSYIKCINESLTLNNKLCRIYEERHYDTGKPAGRFGLLMRFCPLRFSQNFCNSVSTCSLTFLDISYNFQN